MTSTTLKQLPPIHALKAGTFQGINGPATITPTDLAQIASSYNPELHEAPAVIGHPATDDPAWGWVRAAVLKKDGLWLDVDATQELSELVEGKRYKKVSVSLYPPDHPANPTPGVFSLKHLGFLGAQVPAVKGLKPIGLSEDRTLITIEFSEKESEMDEEEKAALAAREAAVKQAEADLAEQKKAVELAEKQVAQREKELNQAKWNAKVDEVIQTGKLLPKDKKLMLAFCETLSTQTIDLGEGEKPQLDQFFGFLDNLPVQVDLSEIASPDKKPEAQPIVNFSAPTGYEVDAAGANELKEAHAWMAKNPGKTMIDYVNTKGN